MKARDDLELFKKKLELLIVKARDDLELFTHFQKKSMPSISCRQR
jgi:hypothetical protein